MIPEKKKKKTVATALGLRKENAHSASTM